MTTNTMIPVRALVAATEHDLPTLLPPDREAVAATLQHAIAPATWRAYKRGWLEFLTYCRRIEVSALPADPETVRNYLIALATTPRPRKVRENRTEGARGALPSVSLIEQHVAAITTLHKWGHHANPCTTPEVTLTIRAIKRNRAALGDHPRPKVAARAALVRRMLDALGDGARAGVRAGALAVRDRAIILVLAERGLRRGEVSGLNMADVRPLARGGWELTIRVSKTDPTGSSPRRVPLHPLGGQAEGAYEGAYCPAGALTEWLAVRGRAPGPLFQAVRQGRVVTWDRFGGEGRLRPDGVGAVVKRAAKAAGLTKEEVAAVGAHSLRRGKITDDVIEGRPITRIAEEVGHKDINTTKGYVEAAQVEDPSAWASAASRIAREGGGK